MRIVLLGAPGSGKGTQAAMLKAELRVPHISTGDMLRAAVRAGTPLGLQAKTVMDAGHLVSDDLLMDMLEQRLAEPDARGGFILDGYPRNLTQCEALETLLGRLRQPVDIALKLDVPSELIVDRLAGRATAEGRKDDDPDTVRKRLSVYAEQTAPVADFYARLGRLAVLNGVGEVHEVFSRILAALPRAAASA